VRAPRAHIVALLVLAAFAARPGWVAADPRGGTSFHLIVNPANPVTAVDRSFLAEAFLKKTTRWQNDELIRPVDLGADSPVRRHFSEEVLKKSVAAVKSYWQQLVLSGRGLPPPELDSEDLIVRFVLKNPGAIGYVSGGANLEGAKVIAVR
jgi:ABC-type phosphate transport system substrate-binding protein